MYRAHSGLRWHFIAPCSSYSHPLRLNEARFETPASCTVQGGPLSEWLPHLAYIFCLSACNKHQHQLQLRRRNVVRDQTTLARRYGQVQPGIRYQVLRKINYDVGYVHVWQRQSNHPPSLTLAFLAWAVHERGKGVLNAVLLIRLAQSVGHSILCVCVCYVQLGRRKRQRQTHYKQNYFYDYR